MHSSTLYLIRQQVELAEKIARLSGIPDARVFFTNSGSEANEAALLMATSYRRSNQILAIRNSYHGRTYATIGITGNRGWSSSSMNPLNVSYLHSGDRMRGLLAGRSDAEYIDAVTADLREVLATQTSGDVAAMIAEPIQGVGGFVQPPDGLVRRLPQGARRARHPLHLRRGADRLGPHRRALLGLPGARRHARPAHVRQGHRQRLALAGVVGRAEVINSVPGISFSTFGGNPVSTAAGNAVVDYLLAHDLQGNAARVGAILQTGLRDAAAEPRNRRRRTRQGPDARASSSSSRAPRTRTRTRRPGCSRSAGRGGLLVGKGGLYGNTIRMGPPLTLTEDEAREGLDILLAAIAAVDGELSA